MKGERRKLQTRKLIFWSLFLAYSPHSSLNTTSELLDFELDKLFLYTRKQVKKNLRLFSLPSHTSSTTCWTLCGRRKQNRKFDHEFSNNNTSHNTLSEQTWCRCEKMEITLVVCGVVALDNTLCPAPFTLHSHKALLRKTRREEESWSDGIFVKSTLAELCYTYTQPVEPSVW